VLASLPFHHRDPFDRLLIAQAMVEDVPVVSADSAFSLYSVQMIWNGLLKTLQK
jgi:PIN domain nuclease of toxin-antitoxin system